ncbi:MAG: CBS domain-containing protein [bacterium]|nr:CBS domain-containing protein [bacterium]
MKKEVLYLVLLVVVSAAVCASTQPALPTTFYGKVTNSDNSLAEGVSVIANWIDNNGNSQTTTTTTLTAEEADALGSPNLVGYYLFNKGYVKAKSGTEITVTAAGAANSDTLSADPGGDIMQGVLIIPTGTDTTPPEISAVTIQLAEDKPIVIRWTTNELAVGELRYWDDEIGVINTDKTNMGTKHTINPKKIQTYKRYLFEVAAKDADGNEAVDDNNGNYYSFETGGYLTTGASGEPTEPTAGSSGQPGEPSDIPEDWEPSEQGSVFEDPTQSVFPTSIYGSVVDEAGNPIENAEVTAEWTDSEGDEHEKTVETLTEEEAVELGDEALAGYYMFNEGEIKAEPDSTISITTPELDSETKRVKAKPGEPIRVTDSQVLYGEKGTEKEEEKKPPLFSRVINSTGLFMSGLGDKAKSKKSTIYSIIGLVAILFASYVVYKGIKRRRVLIEEDFYKTLHKATQQYIKDFETRKPVNIDYKQTMKDVAAALTQRDVGSVVITKAGFPIGTITEKNFVNDMIIKNKKPEDGVTVANSLSVFGLEMSSTISEAHELMRKNNTRSLAVLKNKKVEGILTQTHVARALKEMASNVVIEAENTPNVSTIMTKNVVCMQKNDSLIEAKKRMNSNDVSCVVVMDKNKPIGIVTDRDILNEIAANPLYVKKLKICNVMKSPVVSIEKNLNIFEANAIMIEKKFRRLPVLQNKVLVGIVTQTDVVDAIFKYVHDIMSNAKAGRKRDFVITRGGRDES